MDEVAESLNSFLSSVTQFDDWYGQVADILESAEKLEADEIAAKIEEIAAQRDDRKANFESMLQNGKLLTHNHRRQRTHTARQSQAPCGKTETHAYTRNH